MINKSKIFGTMENECDNDSERYRKMSDSACRELLLNQLNSYASKKSANSLDYKYSPVTEA